MTTEGVELVFGHVQPPPMDGREMELHFRTQPSGFGRLQVLVEGRWVMRAEVVHDQPDALGIGVTLVNERLDEPDLIFGGPAIYHPNGPPAHQRFRGQKQVLGSASLVVVVGLGDCPRFGWRGVVDLRDQLRRVLVKTNDRPLGIVRLVVQAEHLLHMIDELGVLFGWNHPLLLSVRLQSVF